MNADDKGRVESVEAILLKVKERGSIDPDEIKQLRLGFFGEQRLMDWMGEGATVNRQEAELLFQINDAMTMGDDREWRAFFVEAVTSHVCRDALSPGTLDDEETEFLLARLQRTEGVDRNELEMLVRVLATVHQAPDRLQRVVLEAVRECVLADHLIDAEDTRLVRLVVEGAGGRSGKQIDHHERQWLSAIDAAVAGRAASPSWTALMLELGIRGE